MSIVEHKNTRSRKLAAILFADMVGYTAMMQSNEDLGRRNLNVFHDAINEKVIHFKGQLINNYGDGCLCTFDSALDAIQCAKVLQTIFLSDPIIPVRLGLHMGDVFFESNNVYGDSINLASRIESLGVAGAVLFSSKIRDEIKNRPDMKVKSLGSFAFKNVDEPMQVFALSEPGFAVPLRKDIQGKLKTSKSKNSRLPFILALIIAAVAIAYMAWMMKPVSTSPNSSNLTEQSPDINTEPATHQAWNAISGAWDFYFFYNNDSTIVYNGTMQISGEDSLIASFEILTPRSRRPEKIQATSVLFSPKRKTLKGTLVHDMYKIRGGYLEDIFELNFQDDFQKFHGTGQCMAYCAEGTENAAILWFGTKGVVE